MTTGRVSTSTEPRGPLALGSPTDNRVGLQTRRPLPLERDAMDVNPLARLTIPGYRHSFPPFDCDMRADDERASSNEPPCVLE